MEFKTQSFGNSHCIYRAKAVGSIMESYLKEIIEMCTYF